MAPRGVKPAGERPGTAGLKSSEALKHAEDPLDLLKDLEKELGFEDELAVEGSRVRIHVDSRRYGKQVTVLEGFDPALDVEALGRELKKSMGTGGTVRDRTIELQGDHRKGVREYLEKRGFKFA